MDLGETDPAGDLGLAEVLAEAQLDDAALVRVQGSQRRAERDPVVGLGRRIGVAAVLLELDGGDADSSACSRRGTRTGAARSRRWWRISPAMKGAA